MWSAGRTIIREGWSEKTTLLRNGAAAPFADVIAAWRNDATFREYILCQLTQTPFAAYFWEMPPIRRDTVGRNYEFVTIRSDALAHMPPDPVAFAAIFRNAADDISVFQNLGGDALLIAPRPIAGHASYPHLAEFLRTAPQTQQHELLVSLAGAIERELRHTSERIWISTSGLGVAWLHIRLDSFPKYYQYRPYAEDD